jgi:hypothetical protein
MLRAAVDEYGYANDALVEAMLSSIRRWVRDDPEPGEWAPGELEYMERSAPLLEGFATRAASVIGRLSLFATGATALSYKCGDICVGGGSAPPPTETR